MFGLWGRAVVPHPDICGEPAGPYIGDVGRINQSRFDKKALGVP